MLNIAGSPALANLTISGNAAQSKGGGMYNAQSSPALTNVTISGNSAEIGGGLANAQSNPALTNVTISGNTANFGGGMFSQASAPILTSVLISGNAAEHGGGLANEDSSPALTNVTLSGNTAQISGGGLANYQSSRPMLINTIIWGNSSGISNVTNSTPTISFSLVQGSGGSSAWNPATGTDGGGNRDIDPLFITPVPTAPSTGGNLRLQDSSPTIDGGTPYSNIPSLPPTDLDGNPRIIGATVDMGAYERQVFIGSHTPYPLTYGNAYIHTFRTNDLNTTHGFTFTLTAGSMPPELTLDPSGVLTGTPTAVASYPNLAVTASNGVDSATQIFTLTISPARLDVALNPITRTYGAANPALSYTISGLMLGDSPAEALTGTPLTWGLADSPVGSYPIFQGSLAATSNYNLIVRDSMLTIAPAPLTITANNLTLLFGQANPPFTAEFSGLVLGEDASVFSSPLTFSTSATPSSPAGSYPITPGGASAANYAITFVPGTLTITSTPRTLYLPLVLQP